MDNTQLVRYNHNLPMLKSVQIYGKSLSQMIRILEIQGYVVSCPNLALRLVIWIHLRGQAVSMHSAMCCLAIDSFTASLPGPDGIHLPAVRVGDCRWALKTSGNSHSCEPINHRSWGNPNIYLYDSFTKGRQSIGGHASYLVAASWSSGRAQDSGSRSSSEFNTCVYPVGVSARCAPEQGNSRCIASLDSGANGYLWGLWFVSRGAKLRVSDSILPGSRDGYPNGYMDCKGPNTREGTCKSLHRRALSLDVDSKQWLYFYLYTALIVLRPQG